MVLIFCSENDRLDNRTNKRYFDYYKPYFATQPDGSIVQMGEPVPKSHLLYYKENWLVHNLWLARLVTDAYVRLRYPQVFVSDPTEKLVGKIRDFAESNGSKFMVGLQYHDDALMSYMKANRIPFISLEGAPAYSGGWGSHWRPEGHQFVADRIGRLLSENHVVAGNVVSK